MAITLAPPSVAFSPEQETPSDNNGNGFGGGKAGGRIMVRTRIQNPTDRAGLLLLALIARPC